ncbi:MAG: hypothetical protein J2P15_10355 [Micromonosporaceae bacterium]|nr:hypothetical protein [Micromonosporaceae bacterium]
MPDLPESDRVAQACAYLRILLSRPGDYRYRWERRLDQPNRIDQSTGSEISEQAVGAVLTADTLLALDSQRGDSESTVAHPAALETARRALAGSALHPDDLELFVSAFGLSDRHANRLRQLRQGAPQLRVLIGDERLKPEIDRLSATPHETVSVHDSHTIGPDGLPTEHESILVIRSVVPLLESVPYRFDTDEIVVQVVRGGRVAESMYRIAENVWGTDLVLDRPLRMGESALLQVHSTFCYRQPPAPEFRRGVLRSTQDLTMWVRFHPQRIPEHLWIARWDRLDQARIVEREPVELDSEFSARQRFGKVERAVVGFTWEWAAPSRG